MKYRFTPKNSLIFLSILLLVAVLVAITLFVFQPEQEPIQREEISNQPLSIDELREKMNIQDYDPEKDESLDKISNMDEVIEKMSITDYQETEETSENQEAPYSIDKVREEMGL